jgi:hypothetical protein
LTSFLEWLISLFKEQTIVAKEHESQISGPVPPQLFIPPIWLENKFEEIAKLQLVIIEQQGDVETALNQIQAESIMLYSKVKELEALSGNKLIPELEKIIKTVSRRATIIDEKVEDIPPVPPVDTRPPTDTRPPGSVTRP